MLKHEIERKFLVKILPKNWRALPHVKVRQGYLAIAQDRTEIRVRQKGKIYLQTIKSGGDKTRLEIEIKITKKQFDALWPATKNRRVEKMRYFVPHAQKSIEKIEMDLYQGSLKGLKVVEVEFPNQKASNNFKKNDWFGREVTLDRNYKNQNLALYGLPKKCYN